MTQFDPKAANSYGTTQNPQAYTPVPYSQEQVNGSQADQNAATATSYNAQQQGEAYNPQNASQSVPASGSEDSGSRKRPKIISQHPIFSMDADLRQTWQNHITHQPGFHDRAMEQNGDMMNFYAEMAKIDPTSATYNPPPTNIVPMPRGGLDTLAREHLGAQPVPPAYDATREERDAYTKAKAEYDQTFADYKHLLYRLNKDTLRTDDRYTLGQATRVFAEFE